MNDIKEAFHDWWDFLVFEERVSPEPMEERDQCCAEKEINTFIEEG